MVGVGGGVVVVVVVVVVVLLLVLLCFGVVVLAKHKEYNINSSYMICLSTFWNLN